jgi:hypothetical protein
MSKEQSSSGPHVSSTGHLLGQSMCLFLLQKKVINIFYIYYKSILNNCGAYIEPSLTLLTLATER